MHDLESLKNWLLERADRLQDEIWANDPIVKDHIRQLRGWAQTVDNVIRSE